MRAIGDVEILRNAVVKVTQILTDMKIKVTQIGEKAYVVNSVSNGMPIEVNIPNIPDNASEELCRAIQGFVDKQVSRVLFTHWPFYKSVKGNDKNILSIYELLEDIHCEGKMNNLYQGSRFNADKLASFFIQNNIKPALLQLQNGQNEALSTILIPVIRALANQEIYSSFMKEFNVWDVQPLPAIHTALKPFSSRLENINSSQEAYKLAEDIYKVLMQGSDSSSNKEGTSSDQNKNKSEEKDKEKNKDKSESEEKDKDKSEEKDKEKNKDKKDKSESEEKDKEKNKDKSESEEKDKSDEGEGEDKGESESDEGESDEGEGDEGEGDEGEGESQSSEFEDEASFDETSKGEDAKPAVGSNVSSIFAKSAILKESDIFSDKITEMSKNLIKEQNYWVYTKDFDVIANYNSPNQNSERTMKFLKEMNERTEKITGPLRKNIERLVAARSAVIKTGGHRSGKLHTANLHRLSAGDDRIFGRKQEARSIDTAISLLIDNSGSMRAGKMSLAMISAYAISDVLDKLNVKFECLGFTTLTESSPAVFDKSGFRKGFYETMRKAATSGLKYARNDALFMPIYKGFNEKINTEIKTRYACSYSSQDFLYSNVDGECVEIAAKRLLAQTAKKKLLIVLSDGQPAAASGNMGYGQTIFSSHLKEVCKDIEASKGIELIGIGIQDASVKSYYKNNFVIQNLEELPVKLLEKIRSTIVS